MQRTAADGLVRRRHGRESPDDDLEFHGAGIKRLVRRFGSHSSNESMAPVYYRKMAFIAFFNAGVRALDIRDPYHPTEVGYFIPSITAATDKRCVTIDGKDRCKVAIQTNNVETDERGYIYIVDRANTGLHILELTGPARAVAGLP